MKVTSTGILHGVISDEYGKRGTQFNAHGMPCLLYTSKTTPSRIP